ncbi:hypothetical protein EP7_003004 [Isosphaeraceae bacterium EP7]
MTMQTVRVQFLAAAVGLGLGLGCQAKSDYPETVPVSGKVSYRGQALPKGTITFQSDEGHAATGQIGEGGQYHLSTFGEGDGAVPGHHRVIVIANDGDEHLMPGSSPGYKKPTDLVPKKYGKVETSGLEEVVSKDKTSYDIDIK